MLMPMGIDFMGIKVTNRQSRGWDEAWCEWFTCPKCEGSLEDTMKFCPYCGEALEWDIEPTDRLKRDKLFRYGWQDD